MEQWFFKITSYADALLDDLATIDWPERTKKIQSDWIGRSEGAEVLFRVDELDLDIPVFTTRPDTLFGATFFVLAPESPLVEQLVEGPSAPTRFAPTRASRARAPRRSARRARRAASSPGRYATNPVNGEQIPIWVADYVLMEYGTGAIMAVPAHDERDREFAERFELPIVPVIDDDGTLINSAQFDGLPSKDGKQRDRRLARASRARASRRSTTACATGASRGSATGAARSRSSTATRAASSPVPEEELPVLLPDVENYRPKGEPPLASNQEWHQRRRARSAAGRRGARRTRWTRSSTRRGTSCATATRGTTQAPFDRGIVDYWMPIDQYVGGIDHAKGHLLYSRFFIKVMNDLGLVGFREPFQRLFHQGWVKQGGTKMSKSKGNVIGPDALVDPFGADAVRLYILFHGPGRPGHGVDARRASTGCRGSSPASGASCTPRPIAARGRRADTPLARKAHETIARVTDDIGRRFVFNTPIAAVMELVNELSKAPEDPAARFAAETVVSLIQPYAPHVAEELWSRLGRERLWEEPWPVSDESLLQRDTVQLVVQVNGKVRDRIEVPAGLPDDELVALAKASEKVQAHLNGEGAAGVRRAGQARQPRRLRRGLDTASHVETKAGAGGGGRGATSRTNGDRPGHARRLARAGLGAYVWRDVLHEGAGARRLTSAAAQVRAVPERVRLGQQDGALPVVSRNATRSSSLRFTPDSTSSSGSSTTSSTSCNSSRSSPLAAETGFEPSRLELIVVGQFPGARISTGSASFPRPSSRRSGRGGSHRPPSWPLPAHQAWSAVRAPDPPGWRRSRTSPLPGLPYLAPALRRLLEELPDVSDGLSRTERRRCVRSPAGRGQLRGLPLAQADEEAPFLGDTWFFRALGELGRSARRLVETVRESPCRSRRRWASRGIRQGSAAADRRRPRVLAGAADRVELLGIDRWVLGTHLDARAVWRWDPRPPRSSPPS